jgi:hypothetical protein
MLGTRHEFRTRSDHELFPPLLENMRDPARHSTECQETAGRVGCGAKSLANRHQRMAHAQRSLLEGHVRCKSPIARSGAEPFGDLDQCVGSRITVAIERMVEGMRHRYRSGSTGHLRPRRGAETLLEQIATKSECRAEMNLKGSPDAGIEVVSGRRGNARGESRRGELVIGDDHENAVQRLRHVGFRLQPQGPCQDAGDGVAASWRQVSPARAEKSERAGRGLHACLPARSRHRRGRPQSRDIPPRIRSGDGVAPGRSPDAHRKTARAR